MKIQNSAVLGFSETGTLSFPVAPLCMKYSHVF
jgi:hypothetical protein